MKYLGSLLLRSTYRNSIRVAYRPAVQLAFLLISYGPLQAQYAFEQVIRNGDEGVEGIGAPSHVVVSPDNRFVYVAGYSDQSIAVFSREEATGTLEFQDAVKNGEAGVVGLDGVRQLVFSEDGRFLYAVSELEHALTTFSINADGTLTFQNVLRDGESGVDGLEGARSLAVSPDGNNIYVAAFADHAVSVFSVDSLSGEVTFEQATFDTGAAGATGDLKLRAAIGVAVSSDNRHVYVIGHEDDGVSVFSRNTDDGGRLTNVQNIDNWASVLGFGYVRPTGIARSKDGKSVYVSGFGGSTSGNLTVFSRNATNGELQIQQRFADNSTLDDRFTPLAGFGRASSLTLSPDDRYVYNTSYDNSQGPDDYEMVSFRRSSNGLLEADSGITNGEDEIQSPNAIAFDTTGHYFYVVAGQGSALTAFSVYYPSIAALSAQRGFPGDELTIRGEDFRAVQANSRVAFNQAAAEVLDWSDTAVQVKVPELEAGDYKIYVTVNGYSDSINFTVEVVVVRIEDFFPRRGSTTDTVSVWGENFGNEPAVLFGGVEAEVIEVFTDSVVVRVPNLTSGEYPITVTVDGSTSPFGEPEFVVDQEGPVPELMAGSANPSVDITEPVRVQFSEAIKLPGGITPLSGCTGFTEVVTLVKLSGRDREPVEASVCYDAQGKSLAIDAPWEEGYFYELRVDATALMDDLGNRGPDTLFLFTTGTYQAPKATPATMVMENGHHVATLETSNARALKQAVLHYRGICSPEAMVARDLLENARREGNRFTDSLPDIGDSIGIEYYYSVTDFFGSTDTTDTLYDYRRLEAGEVVDIWAGETSDRYNLVSFPLQLDETAVSDVFFDQFGGYDKEKWRLLTVEPPNRYVEYAGFTNVKPGKAYLLIYRDKGITTINAGAGERVNVRKDQPFRIPVAPGWNLIGNPYPLDVDWSVVVADPDNADLGLESTIREYESNWGSSGTRLPKYKGALIFVHGEGDFLSVPLSAKVTTGRQRKTPSRKGESVPQAWEVPLSVRRTEGGISRTGAGFGMHPAAQASGDRYDAMTPPPLGAFLDITFRHPEYFYPLFSKDMVPVSEQYIWEFRVETSESGILKLEWDPALLPEGDQSLRLVDREEGQVVDMRKQAYYTFPASDSRPFQIFYGPPEFIDEQLSPERVHLPAGYPNPFTQEITLPFALPPADTDYRVRYTIYSLSGQRVCDLLDKSMPGGFHEVQWDGRSENGQHLPGGMYFGELRVGQGATVDIQRKRIVLMAQ